MKVLLRIPLSPYIGYGNDGIGLTQALLRAGADVYLQPTTVQAPLPPEVAALLSKPVSAPFDLVINHVDPNSLRTSESERAAAEMIVGWTMWESSNFGNLKGRSKLKKNLKGFDALIGYDPVSSDCLRPYFHGPVLTVQGGYEPERWPEVQRDWNEENFYFAQPLTSKIHTPSGWKTMRDMRVGTVITNPQGGSQQVTAIHPKGKQDVFRVTLKDGSTTECSADHLWRVRDHRSGLWETKSTSDIQALGLRAAKTTWRWEVPAVAPVDYAERVDLPIDPYLMGALLGDGTLSHPNSGISMVSVDEEILTECAARVPDGVSVTRYKDSGYDRLRFKKIVPYLASLGVTGTNSITKFVPSVYLHASTEQREKVLQGLMDTDGTVTKTGTPAFVSKSKHLADAVVELARSLGGSASIKTYEGLKAPYVVHLSGVDRPFLLARKQEKVLVRSRRHRRAITSIEHIGVEEVQCISVSGAQHTYVTDDYVVTHNCMVGQLSIRKDPFVSIEAFSQLKAEYPEEFANARLSLKTQIPGLHSKMEDVYPGLRIYYDNWDEATLRAFYASQHVLLAPSRGEGKNMPALEFQSTGGVVIATNWGGHQQWLNPAYNYPLDYELSPVDEYTPGTFNARASVEHMKELMLHIYRNRDEAREKGALAARTIPLLSSWDSVVERFFLNLKESVPGGERLWMKYVTARQGGGHGNG